MKSDKIGILHTKVLFRKLSLKTKPNGLSLSNLAIFFLIRCTMIHYLYFRTNLSASYISRGDNSFDHPVFTILILISSFSYCFSMEKSRCFLVWGKTLEWDSLFVIPEPPLELHALPPSRERPCFCTSHHAGSRVPKHYAGNKYRSSAKQRQFSYQNRAWDAVKSTVKIYTNKKQFFFELDGVCYQAS